MSEEPTSYGSYPTPETLGIDRGYEKDRPRAVRELENTMSGPKEPLKEPDVEGIKHPEGEFAVPARFIGTEAALKGPGPNSVGNSSGQGPIDPQGQQGGTEGGQAGSP